MITDGDIEIVRYFIEHKRDITRWSRWGEKRPLFEQHHPNFIRALDGVERAERLLLLELKALDG